MKCRAFIFFLIAALLLCAGCSSMGKKEEMPTTITVWHVYGGQTDSPLNDLIEQFNQTVGKKQGIIINVTSVSSTWTIHDELLASAREDPGSGDERDGPQGGGEGLKPHEAGGGEQSRVRDAL